jgi:hypothetical protein
MPRKKAAAAVTASAPSDLALRAQEVRAAAELDADDRRPAAPARLAFAVVDVVLRRVVADLAEEVAVLLVGQGTGGDTAAPAAGIVLKAALTD